MALLAVRPASDDLSVAPLIEHMVRTGQWWDYTDELSHRLADLHDRHPESTAALVRAVERRRRHVDAAHRDHLAARPARARGPGAAQPTVIEPNVADREFFIRKAIGWALREYARVAPEWVRAFADAHALSSAEPARSPQAP